MWPSKEITQTVITEFFRFGPILRTADGVRKKCLFYGSNPAETGQMPNTHKIFPIPQHRVCRARSARQQTKRCRSCLPPRPRFRQKPSRDTSRPRKATTGVARYPPRLQRDTRYCKSYSPAECSPHLSKIGVQVLPLLLGIQLSGHPKHLVTLPMKRHFRGLSDSK